MFLVVLWHFFYYTAPSFAPEGTEFWNLLLSDALLLPCSLGVNLFVLISSYFLVQKEFKAERIIRLWLTVLFYSILFSAIGWILGGEKPGVRAIFIAFLPILNARYWFVGPYLGMVLLAPFLSKTALVLTQRQYQWLLVILTLTCCTFTLNIPYGNTLGAGNGYTLIWFIALFFTGGYCRRFDPFPNRKRIGWLFLIFASGIYVLYIGKALWKFRAAGICTPEFTAYNSFAFPLAVLAFLFFKKTPENQLLKFLSIPAASTFGVYLIHDHPVVRDWIWSTLLPHSGVDYSSAWYIPAGLTASLLVFIACVIIDRGRQILHSWLRIDTAIKKFCP